MKHPPLNAIRAFVLTGRQRSFRKAADELSVTQGAVSQQIARLEEYLGCRLFVRERRGIDFTDEGRRLYIAVTDSLERIDFATAALRSEPRADTLTVTTLNSFASQWLMPRLPDFQRRYPDIRLRLDTTNDMLDIHAQQADLGIRYGTGDWPGLTAQRLIHEQLFPVATPGYAATIDLDAGPEILLQLPLLYDVDEQSAWAQWFSAAGCAAEVVPLTHGFTDSLVLLRAILTGTEGVALVRRGLVSDELEAGDVVRLFSTQIEAPGAFYLVYRHDNPRASLHAFRDWIATAGAEFETQG